jgi:hypothetical protein
MATTTNYGWTTPDDTALVKDGASAIRTLGSSVDTTVKALNPGTTSGDLDYYTAATTKARIAKGTAGQVFTMNSGATAPEWATPSTAPTSYGYAAGKNALLNGSFEIWQRGTSSSGNAYLADRWYSALVSGTGTFAQETSVVPTGSTNSIKFTASATAQPALYQAIETANAIRYAGQTVTVSGLIAASTSTGFTIDVQHSSSVDNGVTGSWTSITATSGGTATATSTTFVAISGVYAIPSTAKSLRVRIFTTSTIANADVVYFDNLQLEGGSTVTTFQRATGSYGTELEACQRYYFRATGTSQPLGAGVYYASTTALISVKLPVTMRTSPTYGSSGTDALSIFSNSGRATTANTLDVSSPDNITLIGTTASSTTGYGAVCYLNLSSKYLEVIAEL